MTQPSTTATLRSGRSGTSSMAGPTFFGATIEESFGGGWRSIAPSQWEKPSAGA